MPLLADLTDFNEFPALKTKMASGLIKYRNMLTSGASENQVRLRMVNDGVSPDVVSDFLHEATSCSSPLARNTTNSNSYRNLKHGMIVSEYKKMIGNGVPAPVVRQKMAMSGMEISEINQFFREER